MTHIQEPSQCGLILNTGAIGDCLLSLPLAEALRGGYGLDRVDFIGTTEYLGFYPGRTCIDGVRSSESIPLYRLFGDEKEFVLDDKDRLQDAFAAYEYVVSFLGSGHPHFEQNLLFTLHSTHSAELTVIPTLAPPDWPGHITEFYRDWFLKENQVANFNFQPELLVSPLPDDYRAGTALLEQADIDPDASLIVIQPGSGSADKCWHPDNFLQTAARLKEENQQVVFLLGPAETERMSPAPLDRLRTCETVLENLSLTHVLQVLTQADLFLGNDSGIGHLSAAMGQKTVILFGPTNPARYRPHGPFVHILTPSPDSFHTANESEQTHITRTLLALL
jgi:ADP-heptose:LPS heptosyltransferase